MQHRGVLYRGNDQVAPDTPTARERAGNSQVNRARPRRSEHEFVGTAAHGLRRGLPGRVQQQPGAAPLAVEPGGVGPALVQRCLQGLPGNRVQRSG